MEPDGLVLGAAWICEQEGADTKMACEGQWPARRGMPDRAQEEEAPRGRDKGEQPKGDRWHREAQLKDTPSKGDVPMAPCHRGAGQEATGSSDVGCRKGKKGARKCTKRSTTTAETVYAESNQFKPDEEEKTEPLF